MAALTGPGTRSIRGRSVGSAGVDQRGAPTRHARRRPEAARRRWEISGRISNRFRTLVKRATIEGVPWLWRHVPPAPELTQPVAKRKPWPPCTPAPTTFVDLESVQPTTSRTIDHESVGVAKASTSKRLRSATTLRARGGRAARHLAGVESWQNMADALAAAGRQSGPVDGRAGAIG